MEFGRRSDPRQGAEPFAVGEDLGVNGAGLGRRIQQARQPAGLDGGEFAIDSSGDQL
jgi:hypothetical protein